MREHYEKRPDSVKADQDQWFRNIVENYRDMAPGTYPSDFEHACEYENLVIDPPLHMLWLKKEIETHGGSFVRRKLSSLQELFDLYPSATAYINASGLGSKTITGIEDTSVYADKGQNVLVRSSQTHMEWNRNGEEYTYIIPRPRSGVLVIGGIHMGDEDLTANWDPKIAEDELRRGHILAPSVISKNPDIAGYAVGIRPARHGGFRLDSQTLGTAGVRLLHAYGFSGTGYAYAYGVADQLVDWVRAAECEQAVYFKAKL